MTPRLDVASGSGCLDATDFDRDGYVIARQLVDLRTVAGLRRAAEALAAAGRDLESDTAVGRVHYKVQSASGRTGEPAVSPGALRKIVFGSAAEPAIARLRTDPRILAALESAGLRAPRCIVDQVNMKLPRVGTGFPWHQDAHFVSRQQRGIIATAGGMNLVLALDRADAGNGGLAVLAGTHRQGLLDFEYDTSTTNAGVFDESRRVDLVLEPGDAVLFHPYLAHGSGPNRSDRPRRMVALWCVAGGRVSER